METTVQWKSGMCFETEGRANNIKMDASFPLGRDEGLNPKEVLLSALASCAGMDVIGLLKKRKHKLEHLLITASATLTNNQYPQVFTSIILMFEFSGLIYNDDAVKAVELSQTKYSGISAMLSRGTPIHWIVFVNHEKVGDGKASFEHYDDFYQSRYEG